MKLIHYGAVWLLALSLSGSVAAAADSSTQVQRAHLEEQLQQARDTREAREAYLARMAKAQEDLQAFVQAEFHGEVPERAVLAKMTHEQVVKVKSLTPVLPDTPERQARRTRIRELTLELRDQQNQFADEFKAVKTAPDPVQAKQDLDARMRKAFETSNTELLALQNLERREREQAVKGNLVYQAERDRLSQLIRVGETQDRVQLMASARALLIEDIAREQSLQKELESLEDGRLEQCGM